MNKKEVFGSLVATAVASMILSAPLLAADKAADATKAKSDSYCQNNSCKGKSACGGHGNSCKGQNDCKGHGMVDAKSKAACAKKSGVWTKTEEKKAE